MSDGAKVPSNYREMMASLQRRIAILERGLGERARQSEVDGLDSAVDRLIAGEPPLGTVIMWAGDVPEIPVGWLRCDGHAESRTAYPKLFALFGTTYGAGDGSTTFNLPNFSGRVPAGMYSTGDYAFGAQGGAETHTHTMPSHTHSIPSHTHSTPNHSHPLTAAGWAQIALDDGNDWIAMNTVGADAWQGDYRTGTGTLTVGTTTTSYSIGAPLDGDTGSGGSSTTGSGGSGTTGSTDPGDTHSGDSRQPYSAILFLIKAA